MSGFKNFLLRGNLIEIAVAFIMATSFAVVVTKFVEWLTGLMPESAAEYFSTESQSFGAFLNALIAFVLLSAVVYFLIVVPYTKAKERFFPSENSGAPTEIDLLTQIRDSLASRT